MSETIYLPAMRDDGETEVMVEFTVHSWGSPPQTYGPPEMCDPGDPIEVEITDCWLAVDPKWGVQIVGSKDVPRIKLTDAECERILARFYDDPPEPEPDHPEYERGDEL